jgi:hypothetical protein
LVGVAVFGGAGAAGAEGGGGFVGAAEGAGVALFAANHVFTPPCCEHAPFSVLAFV